jgi:hypothetical protein
VNGGFIGYVGPRDLHSPGERSSSPPHCKFVFANWEDDGPEKLEIVAEGFEVE